jgi:steroid delta-isomerase
MSTPVQTRDGETLIRRYYELVDANEVADMVALFQPEATYCRPGYPDLVGHADITRFYARQRKFRSGAHTLTAVLDTGGRVAVHGSFRGELHDGSTMELRFADFFEIGQDGRFSRRDTYYFAPLG